MTKKDSLPAVINANPDMPGAKNSIAPGKKFPVEFTLVISVIVLVAAALVFYIYSGGKTPAARQTENSGVRDGSAAQQASDIPQLTDKITVGQLPEAVFASYRPQKLAVNPSLSGAPVPVVELSNLTAVETSQSRPFDASQKAALDERQFFMAPAAHPRKYSPDEFVDPDERVDDMVDLYRQFGGKRAITQRRPENAVFVTTDYLLHIYHRFIDKVFKTIEQEKFHAYLLEISRTLAQHAAEGASRTRDPALKASFQRVAAYFIVPAVLLETSQAKPESFNPAVMESAAISDETADTAEMAAKNLGVYAEMIPAELLEKAGREIALIYAAENVEVSPLYDAYRSQAGLGNPEDYTQYKPRSHYRENSVLRSYFRAMMWFGRQGLVTKSPELTRDALVIAYLMQGSAATAPVMTLWENIYLPTVFFVGRSDDLTVYDYRTLMGAVYGKEIRLEDLADGNKFSRFLVQCQALKGPAIMGEVFAGDAVFDETKASLQAKTKGFRFMGQRFVPDSYMLSSLTQGDEKPDPETGQSLPSTPTALMVMSVLGSSRADTELDAWIGANARDSDRIIPKTISMLKNEFSALTEADWTQNIYWTWLYAIRGLLSPFAAGYPAFMRTPSWEYKSLNTALGSWTELRHDTLLYAKQSYAEKGGGGGEEPVPPVPKGYVEPNPVFFERFGALVAMTEEGLTARNLLNDEFVLRLKNFRQTVEFLNGIVVKQLQNEPISDELYERLRHIGYETAHLIYPLNGEAYFEKDARSALVADVHTDAKRNQILYEATAKPMAVYVAVTDAGGSRLTRGVVYAYTEFTEDLGERLDDDLWQARVYDGSGQVPPSPQWAGRLLNP